MQTWSFALQLHFGFKSPPPAPRELLAAQGTAGSEGGLGCALRGRPGARALPGMGLAAPQQPPRAEAAAGRARPAWFLPEAFRPPIFLSLGCCSVFFQHFLLQTKPKEYNPEQEVLVTRDPGPALAAAIPAVSRPSPHGSRGRGAAWHTKRSSSRGLD